MVCLALNCCISFIFTLGCSVYNKDLIEDIVCGHKTLRIVVSILLFILCHLQSFLLVLLMCSCAATVS